MFIEKYTFSVGQPVKIDTIKLHTFSREFLFNLSERLGLTFTRTLILFQEGNKIVRQDLNESTLDLSLGLTGHDGDPDSNMDRSKEEEKLGRVNSK